MATLEEIYWRYAGDVQRFAFWLCGDPAEAEDIASETFVRAWAGADDLRMATVKAYLFTIARNLFLQSRRRAGRQETLELDVTDPAPGPEARAQQSEELRAVWKRLENLPEAERSALILRAQHGLPYEEIARCLGVSVVAAKVKVHRARSKLLALRHSKEVRT